MPESLWTSSKCCRKAGTNLAGMVEGDFPLAVLAVENEAEVAADGTAAGGIAVQMPVGGDHGNVFVQDVDGQI